VCSAGLCFCVVNFYLCNFHGSPHLPLMSTRIRVESGILFFYNFSGHLVVEAFFFLVERKGRGFLHPWLCTSFIFMFVDFSTTRVFCFHMICMYLPGKKFDVIVFLK
jgi:hypothetical protein